MTTTKRLTVLALAALLTIAIVAPAAQKAKQPAQQAQPKAQEKVFIPKPIQTVLEQGVAARQGVRDIPFKVFRDFIFPAMQNFHTVFLFNAKNADLGYATPAAAPAPPEKKAPRPDGSQEAQTPPPAGQAAPAAQLQARLNAFLQFRTFVDDQPSKIFREVYIPVALTEDAANYDPEKEQWYSTGYPLPPGRYLLAMALTTVDLKKVGTDYYEFTIPDPANLASGLDTTPIFFVKNLERMDQPEMRTEVHKGFFTYSVLRIVPNIDNVMTPGETMDIFFVILGAKPKAGTEAQPQYDLVVNYEVKQGEKTTIKWQEQAYQFYLVSQQLPLKQTVQIKDEKGERQEQRDLEAGAYQLLVHIKDNVGGTAVDKTVDFTVK